MSCGMWRWAATNPTNEMFSGTFSLSAVVELTLPCSLRRCLLNSNSFIQLCTSMGMSMSRDRNSEMVGDWRIEFTICTLKWVSVFRIHGNDRPCSTKWINAVRWTWYVSGGKYLLLDSNPQRQRWTLSIRCIWHCRVEWEMWDFGENVMKKLHSKLNDSIWSELNECCPRERGYQFSILSMPYDSTRFSFVSMILICFAVKLTQECECITHHSIQRTVYIRRPYRTSMGTVMVMHLLWQQRMCMCVCCTMDWVHIYPCNVHGYDIPNVRTIRLWFTSFGSADKILKC